MAEDVKYLDYQGLTLYDYNIKEWGTTKNEEIKIKQTNGKSDNGTILVTPGLTIPATYYTAEEAAAYNTEHSLVETDPDYKHEGDLKTAAQTTNTNIEANIDGTTIIQDPTTKQLKVASSALVQYIGDVDGEDKYAINISEPDANNNKVVSFEISPSSNVLEKTTTGVKAKVEIHKFADPTIFGTSVKEAYALTANDVVLTGDNNEQVIKIYKDSALLDIKLLHAVPATYYTTEEAEAYNTEHGLNPGDEGYKQEGDEKTPAIKPTYNKLTGWVDIAIALRTEENLALCYAYENADGNILVEAIQVGSFLRENEFKDGLQVNSEGEVSIKYISEKVRVANTPEGVVPGSEEDTGLVDVMTVNLSEGIKINNIQNAINYAAAIAKTTITEVAPDDVLPEGGNPKVIISSEIQSDGHIHYTITGQDLASATLLSKETSRAKNAETSIDSAVGLTKASGDSEARSYTNNGNYIGKAQTNTIKSDISALDTSLKNVEDKVDAFVPITNEEINSLFV